MGEEFDKAFQLLDKWMELKKVPKEKQKEYYQKLIVFLDKKDEFANQRLICFTTGGMALSSGITCLLLRDDFIEGMIGIFLLLYGLIVGTIPIKKEQIYDLEEFTEVEEQRERIKYLLKKRKD